MAEIYIQKKRRPVWPWIIVLLLLIIAAWLFIEFAGKPESREDFAAADSLEINNDYTTSRSSGEVNRFVQFAGDEIVVNDNSIKEGIQLLSSALSSVVDEKFPSDRSLQEKTDHLREKSSGVITETDIAKNSGELKNIFINSAEILNTIQKKQNMNLDDEAAGLKKRAEKLNTAQSLDKQKEEVKNFFSESGNILSALSGSGSIDTSFVREDAGKDL